jgi:hypothetical protein
MRGELLKGTLSKSWGNELAQAYVLAGECLPDDTDIIYHCAGS